MKVGVNKSGWDRKLKLVQHDLTVGIPKFVEQCSDEVMEKTMKNLSGPHYKIGTTGSQTGKMPIPRMTSMLARAQKIKRLGAALILHFTDRIMAPYGKFVHNGTRKMKPRRYRADVIRERRQAWENRWRYLVLGAFRKHGR